MVGRRRNVRAKDLYGIYEARSVLHICTAVSIGIVAGPHFVGPAEHAVVHPSAAGRAGLQEHLGILGPDAIEHFVVTLDIVNPEVGLAGLVAGAHVEHVAVAVPFNIVHIAQLHSAVEHTEHEVLHLGVAQVKEQLVACRIGFAAFFDHHPLGVLLIET